MKKKRIKKYDCDLMDHIILLDETTSSIFILTISQYLRLLANDSKCFAIFDDSRVAVKIRMSRKAILHTQTQVVSKTSNYTSGSLIGRFVENIELQYMKHGKRNTRSEILAKAANIGISIGRIVGLKKLFLNTANSTTK